MTELGPICNDFFIGCFLVDEGVLSSVIAFRFSIVDNPFLYGLWEMRAY